MIKAIIFDFDDTLVQTKKSKWAALIETARLHYELDIDENHIKQFWGKPFDEMLSGVLKNNDSIEKMRESYFAVTESFPMQSHIDAVEVVSDLIKSFKVGILTASNKKLVMDDLVRLQFPVDELFYIQTAEDTKVHKPDPEVFDPILEKLSGLDRNMVLYVGDAMRDYQAAEGAGLRFLGIDHDGQSGFPRDIDLVRSFTELQEHVENQLA